MFKISILDQFEQRLSHLHGARRCGQHEWLAPCPVPAHAGEHSHSVSIWLTDEGIPIYHCHGGCHWQQVRQHIGLDLDAASLPCSTDRSSSP